MKEIHVKVSSTTQVIHNRPEQEVRETVNKPYHTAAMDYKQSLVDQGYPNVRLIIKHMDLVAEVQTQEFTSTFRPA